MNQKELKYEVNLKDVHLIGGYIDMTPKLFAVWAVFLSFAESENLPVLVTNTNQKFSVSTSNTHPEGRAIDVRTRDWPREKINECIEYMEDRIGSLGAVSASTLKPRVIYWHDAGLGEHFHIQVSPGKYTPVFDPY